MDALERAAALADTITTARAETEASRRLAHPIVEGIRASRLNRMALTAENDGLGLPLIEFMGVLEILSGREASVGWIAWNNALPCLFSRHLSAAARAELFSEPGWIYANSTRPSGKAVVTPEGYRMSGRWSLVSGCELAEWMSLMCLVEEGGRPRMTEAGPEMRFLFVHRDDVEIVDTWHVGGLRGTGSHDVVIDDLLVPGERTLTPADAVTVQGPYARIPLVGTLALGYAAQLLGIARAALETAVRIGRSKVTPTPVPDMRDLPNVQLAVAEQSAALDAARSHLFGIADRIWTAAEAGRAATAADLAALWASAWHAIQTGATVVESMYSVAGTTSIYEGCELERISRDVRVMRQHVMGQPRWAESAGRVMLGLAPAEPLFAI